MRARLFGALQARITGALPTLLHSGLNIQGNQQAEQTEIMRHEDGNKSKNTKNHRKHKQTNRLQSYKWSHWFLLF